MKSRMVDAITSNEDSVRLRIFDGDLPADEAAAELLRIERAQHDVTRRRLREAYDLLGEYNMRLLKAWPEGMEKSPDGR